MTSFAPGPPRHFPHGHTQKSSPGKTPEEPAILLGFLSDLSGASLTVRTPGDYFRNFATARATMPPRMPETRNSITPCTPTSSTTNMNGLAAPLAATMFWM